MQGLPLKCSHEPTIQIRKELSNWFYIPDPGLQQPIAQNAKQLLRRNVLVAKKDKAKTET
jgi:hypothetical protein